jgi:hypothetical protein
MVMKVTNRIVQIIHKKPVVAILLFMVILYFPLLFMGYGADNDTFRILEAGDHLFTYTDYVPSRIPGSIVYEVFVHVIRQGGGAFLSNLCTLLISCLGVYCFYQICKIHSIPHTVLLTVIFISHPLWIANSALTHDYVWSVSLSLAGYLLFLRSRYISSAFVWVLAINFRFYCAVFPIVALVLGFIFEPKKWIWFLLETFVVIILTFALYLPSIDFYQYSTKFIAYQMNLFPSRGTLFQAGVFLYRNIYFWGLPILAFALLASALWIRDRFKLFDPSRSIKRLVIFCLAGFVLIEGIYWFFPFQVDYLLPMFPLILILVGVLSYKHPKVLYLLLAICLLLNVVNFNIARPDSPHHATSVQWGFWIEPGYLINNIQLRKTYRVCDTLPCYQSIVQEGAVVDQ